MHKEYNSRVRISTQLTYLLTSMRIKNNTVSKKKSAYAENISLCKCVNVNSYK